MPGLDCMRVRLLLQCAIGGTTDELAAVIFRTLRVMVREKAEVVYLRTYRAVQPTNNI